MPRYIQIHPDEVHLWWANVDDVPPGSSTILDTRERWRAGRFHFERDRSRFVARRSFLKRVLAGYVGVAPDDIRLGTTMTGKPQLATRGGVSFNASHSDGLAVVAVAAGAAVGVDVEHVRPIADATDLAERFFTRQECDEVRTAQGSRSWELFLVLWTRKESLLKAMGTGLTVPLDGFDVSTRGNPDRVQPSGPHGRLPYVVAGLKHPDGLVGAVALEGQEITISNMNGEEGS